MRHRWKGFLVMDVQSIPFATVIGSGIISDPKTKATALFLNTKERGPLAFVVTLQTISQLRDDLVRAELQLSPNQGSA
jgi:hypothetical protein